jgi:hypothetical protein
LEHAKEIMVGAGYDVCPGLRIDAEPDQLLTNGARYRDKRAVGDAARLRLCNRKEWLAGVA